MPSPLIRHLSLLLAIGWATAIFILSSQAGDELPPLISGLDKLLHALVFGVLGVLVLGSMKTSSRGVYTPGQALIAVVLVTLYGILDEFHQRYVPGRSAELLDIAADAVGGIIGVGIAWVLMKSRARNL